MLIVQTLKIEKLAQQLKRHFNALKNALQLYNASHLTFYIPARRLKCQGKNTTKNN